MSDLRSRLLASRRLSPDAIELAGKIGEIAYQLRLIERRLLAAGGRGERPGKGTLTRLSTVQRKLMRASLAYREARGL